MKGDALEVYVGTTEFGRCRPLLTKYPSYRDDAMGEAAATCRVPG